MTESENSQPQDDSDEDIYNDIPEFNFEDELAKLEVSKETYKQEISDLSEKLKALKEENKELKKSNEVLKKNLSTLLKTAQAEIQRKDSMIQELRTKIESITFRRIKNITKDKCTSTEDLVFNPELQFKTEIQKSVHKKKANSHERSSSESERKSIPQEKKRKGSFSKKEENSDCDNNRKSNYKENSKTKFKHSGSSWDSYNNDRHKKRKSSRYEDKCNCRRSYRENHRYHLKYDSFDKKRHSRSSDHRFLSRRRNSRERRDDRRRNDSSEKSRRSRESSERSRKKNLREGKSHSQEISQRSKESSLEKPKFRSSLDKDSVVKVKEVINIKPEGSDGVENKNLIEDCEKQINVEDEAVTSVRNKQVKEKLSGKPDRGSSSDIFSARSPLDALYNDMVSSRSSNRVSSPKSSAILPESDLEDSELSTTLIPNEYQDASESQPEEDWILSFKNERQNDRRPMTLYSRRMMQKFSLEPKSAENIKKTALKIEKKKEPETQKSEKIEEVEKEPGELTDDENIVESSKEFQELTKVASIENDITDNLTKKTVFKELIRKEFFKSENPKVESVLKENQKEAEKSTCMKEESSVCKEIEPNRDIREVIEFSPFKNNYKLIEISPIKRSGTEHILDFYNQRPPPNHSPEQNNRSLSESKFSLEKSNLKTSDASEEKDSWKNSSSEKDFEAELKIIIPSVNENPKDDEKSEKKEVKEIKRKKRKMGSKTLNPTKKLTNSKKRKRRSASDQETEKLTLSNENQKRKRKSSETDVDRMDKKRKIKESEPSRKSTRTKRNSKSETNSKIEPECEAENKDKEDILSFEFFKPAAKAENSVDVDKSVCTTTDYKMMTTMSLTGVVRLETPNKCVEKFKNLMINEQMIVNVMESKNSQFSPLTGLKCVEMTPRRILKNDLMLTDSEDDSMNKQNEEESKSEKAGEEDIEEGGADEKSQSEYSECDSDSGASDFVDLL